MDADQFDKLITALNRIATATLTVSLLNSMGKKLTLKEVQTTFNDCYMIVDPARNTKQQNDFQERIDKKEW